MRAAKLRTGWAMIAGTIAVGGLTVSSVAQEKTASGQSLLKVDWADPEITAFKRGGSVSAAGLDGNQLNAIHLPVLAFSEIPQIVKNVAGPDARPIAPLNPS